MIFSYKENIKIFEFKNLAIVKGFELISVFKDEQGQVYLLNRIESVKMISSNSNRIKINRDVDICLNHKFTKSRFLFTLCSSDFSVSVRICDPNAHAYR